MKLFLNNTEKYQIECYTIDSACSKNYEKMAFQYNKVFWETWPEELSLRDKYVADCKREEGGEVEEEEQSSNQEEQNQEEAPHVQTKTCLTRIPKWSGCSNS